MKFIYEYDGYVYDNYLKTNCILFPIGCQEPSSKKRKKSCGAENLLKSGDVLIGKGGVRWQVTSSQDQQVGRTAQHNVMKESPGPTSLPKRTIVEEDMMSSFCLFIDDFMIGHIKKCTETEARTKTEDTNWNISKEEIYGFIAISYARGVLAKGQSVKHIWSKKWGPPFFKTIMSRDRYTEILKFIRFDMKSTRSERLKSDKFALFSTIWDRFIENCKSCYKPSGNITIDEQLFPTKARYPFTQYIASKPDKFGVKFWLAVDAESNYLLNGFPYLGKDNHRPADQSLSEHVVLKLMEPFLGKGRNVTTDNFFTSVKLAEKLKAKKTSIVGTMNRIRREIPAEIKSMKAPLYSSTVFENNKMTLTVYQGKVSKNVIILSSLHENVSFSDGAKKLPETIAYYNSTKYGVDIVDQMARLYSTKVSSRRWPLQMFYNVLDLAAINAVTLYKKVTGRKISRHEFLLKLVEQIQNVITSDHNQANDESGEDLELVVDSKTAKKGRQNCQVQCSKKTRNKTSSTCSKCKRFVCGKCIAHIKQYKICKICKP